MRLIMQHPHGEACELACLAMICDADLPTIARIAGTDGKPDFDQREAVVKQFGLRLVEGYVTEGYGSRAMGALMRKHPTLLCSLSSCTDINYAHAIVVHDGQCFDPWHGMNPSYPWHIYISRARAYEREKKDPDATR